MALYVYGLMRADDVRGGLNLEQGGRLQPVDAVVRDGLAVVVGQVHGEHVRLQREALLAHSDVLQKAFQHGPVLPLRFGTVVPDEEALERDLVAPRREEWVARLEALAGKGEFQLKVSYREQPLLRSILAGDAAMTRSAQLVRGTPAAASHFGRISLGERINGAIEARREGDARAVIAELQPLAAAVELGTPQQPVAVLNASFLLARDMFDRFDATVEQLAEQRRELMEFKLIGPMPAHSFADRDLPPAAARSSA
jgi:Gas vesicle synthesis protein GvpL/GvpF